MDNKVEKKVWANVVTSGSNGPTKKSNGKKTHPAGSGGGGGGDGAGGGGGGRATAAAVADDTKQKRLTYCQSLVGFSVNLTLRDSGKEIDGIVYAAYDTVLVLQQNSGVLLINLDNIVKPPRKIKKQIVDLETVNEMDDTATQALNEKFILATQRRQQMLNNRNPAASPFARRVFEELQKTFECSWTDSTTICLAALGNLQIADPYTADSVTGSEARAVDRVKSILAKIREAYTAEVSQKATTSK